MPKLISTLVLIAGSALFGAQAAADTRATVPQISGGDGAFVVQVPGGQRQMAPINRGQTPPRRAAQTPPPRRDFILDFGGQGAPFTLPSVREGVRISLN
ncbi:hypothetical protein [Actibacterium sp. MT2.3-13A]|uniref:hypothetical protein n=1 Tax=Actibacterium sp. MT2.3-13A TaxID=2828332 RepID=UPI001BA80521|nr:hypothetical protein [Actibacterium sp. MT2.3-13A]